MVAIDRNSPKLKDWGTVGKLDSAEDVATLIDSYEQYFNSAKHNNIVGVVQRDGYYAFITDITAGSNFDLFAFINAIYDGNVVVNCANAKLLFPKSMSRGEYIESKQMTGTGDMSDNSDEADTGFWDGLEEEPEKHYVLHVSTDSEILIEDADGVTFGRSTSRADYAVGNDLMSRLHARVYLENGKYMVEDLGSRNGTFINNVRVSAGRDKEIKPGNVLRMANEEFKFL